MIGSCFWKFLKKPLEDLASLPEYPTISAIMFQTCTQWQRMDAIVDIINKNIPDHALITFYLENGQWNTSEPLGIKISHAIKDSKWFAEAILNENRKALHLVDDTPDLLILDSLSDWRHPLYKHRRDGWKCFLGKILFGRKDIEEKFNKDFEFIKLLAITDIKPCLKTIISYFKSKNRNLKTVYIHFPVTPEYLVDKWVKRAEELKNAVSLFADETDKREFYQLIIPQEKVIPLTDPSHPNYSMDVWNHFYDEVYAYCARRIVEWYVEGILSPR